MFKHIFVNRLKILLKNKSLIFWTLIFPLSLATFFHLALSNIPKSEKFNPVNIAIVNNDKFQQEENFKFMMKELSSNNENKIFNSTYTTLEDAKQLLNNNKIAGYILITDKIDVFVKKNGLEQTIIKSVIDNYYQMISVANNIYSFNPEAIKSGILEKFNNNEEYLKDISNDNVNYIVVHFYTLIGMVCLYGGFLSISVINETEANLSKKGARVSVAPTHKAKVLFISLLVAFIVHYFEVLILLSYLIFVLGVSFGDQTIYIIILTFVGSLAGITLGSFIGSVIKKSENFKIAILLTVTMTFSFLAGMMLWQMKYIISDNVPLLAVINPINMITDGLYALYYYDTLNKYFYNLISLGVFSAIMIITSYILLRRKKYDSI